MGFSSGPIPLYREFVEVSSCEIFRPKAHRLRRYSVAKSKPVFPRNRILRRKMRVARYPDPGSKNGWYLTESPTNCLSNAKIRSKIGQAVPELLLKNVTVFRVKVRKITSKIDSGGFVFSPIAFKLSEKMDLVYAHIKWWKKVDDVITSWRADVIFT